MNGTHQECTGAASGADVIQGDSTIVSSIRVYDLTQTFIATAGCAIDLYDITGTGSLTIDVNTGSFGLVSTQYGLTATVTTGTGGVTIGNFGAITAGTNHAAIYGETRGGGAVEITTNGQLNYDNTGQGQGGKHGIWAKTSNLHGTAGDISIISNGGGIIGQTADAILVETSSNAHVTINDGFVAGFQHAIHAPGSGKLTVDNRGEIFSIGNAILSGGGNDVINNYGEIVGNIDLGAGSDTVTNHVTGVLEVETKLSAETIVNHGILSPGGRGGIQTTKITGNLQQTSSGQFLVSIRDVDGVVTADKIEVVGDAMLAGTVGVRLSKQGDIGRSGSVVIASVTGGDLTNNLGPVESRGGYKFSLSANYGIIDYLSLNWRLISESVAELITENGAASANQMTTAEVLDKAEDDGIGDKSFSAMVADIADMSPEEAQQAVEQLQPEHFGQRAIEAAQSSQAFVNSALSCPTLAQNPGFIQEGQCYWAKVGGRHFSWDRTARNVGGDEEAWSTTGGVQVVLRDEWRLGFAAGYEHSNVSTNNSASTETDRGQGAIVLKNRWDTLSIATSAFAGYGWSDTKRHIGLAGAGTAESESNMWFAGTQTRLSLLVERPGGWYMKPMIDLNATRLETDDFVEHGAGAASLAIAGDAIWVLTVSPAFEIGAEIRNGGLVLRPFARLGATFYDDAVYDTTASFIAAPGSSFTVGSEFDTRYIDVAAGIDVLTAEGIDIKLSYDGRFSEHSDMHAGGIKASLPF